MTKRASLVFDIYRGDDFDDTIGIWDDGGGGITDGVLTAGTNTLGSVRGIGQETVRPFNNADIGTQVTLLNGAGITDGRTITAVAVGGLSCTFSGAAATVSRTKAILVVRARNLSTITITAQCRPSPDGAVLFAFPISTTRLPYGAIHTTIISEGTRVFLGLPAPPATLTTDLLVSGGNLDIQFKHPDGMTETPIIGTVTLDKDYTRP